MSRTLYYEKLVVLWSRVRFYIDVFFSCWRDWYIFWRTKYNVDNSQCWRGQNTILRFYSHSHWQSDLMRIFFRSSCMCDFIWYSAKKKFMCVCVIQTRIYVIDCNFTTKVLIAFRRGVAFSYKMYIYCTNTSTIRLFVIAYIWEVLHFGHFYFLCFYVFLIVISSSSSSSCVWMKIESGFPRWILQDMKKGRSIR